MSESTQLQIALISAASLLVTALVAFIGTIWSVRRSHRDQLVLFERQNARQRDQELRMAYAEWSGIAFRGLIAFRKTHTLQSEAVIAHVEPTSDAQNEAWEFAEQVKEDFTRASRRILVWERNERRRKLVRDLTSSLYVTTSTDRDAWNSLSKVEPGVQELLDDIAQSDNIGETA